jgi:hypothetical protein
MSVNLIGALQMENVLIVNPVIDKGDIFDKITLKISHTRSVINCLGIPYEDEDTMKISDREVTYVLGAVDGLLEEIATLINAFYDKSKGSMQ